MLLMPGCFHMDSTVRLRPSGCCNVATDTLTHLPGHAVTGRPGSGAQDPRPGPGARTRCQGQGSQAGRLHHIQWSLAVGGCLRGGEGLFSLTEIESGIVHQKIIPSHPIFRTANTKKRGTWVVYTNTTLHCPMVLVVVPECVIGT